MYQDNKGKGKCGQGGGKAPYQGPGGGKPGAKGTRGKWEGQGQMMMIDSVWYGYGIKKSKVGLTLS